MTEASKTRKNGRTLEPVKVTTLPPGYKVSQLEEVRRILKNPMWLPSSAKVEFLSPKARLRVVTTGVSCRMGVGGRRGRKRRRVKASRAAAEWSSAWANLPKKLERRMRDHQNAVAMNVLRRYVSGLY